MPMFPKKLGRTITRPTRNPYFGLLGKDTSNKISKYSLGTQLTRGKSIKDFARGITGRKSSKQKGLEQDARDLEVSNQLREDVLGSLVIDEITRGELLDQLDVGKHGRVSTSGYLNANAMFERASKGADPIYRSRMFIQERIRLQQNQPGRDQVILTGRSPVAIQAERVLTGDMSDMGGNR